MVLLKARVRVGIDIAFDPDYLPTVDGFGNLLMLKHFYITLPETSNRGLMFWSCAVLHSKILTVPCERGLVGFLFEMHYRNNKFGTIRILASIRIARSG
jgi:hypothetical protein